MRVRKLAILSSAWTVLLCVSLMLSLLGASAVFFDDDRIPVALWWVLGAALLILCVAAYWRPRKDEP